MKKSEKTYAECMGIINKAQKKPLPKADKYQECLDIINKAQKKGRK